MKYCQKCGAELCDEAYVCTRCGCKVAYDKKADSSLGIIAKVFMIIGCVSLGCFIIPLAWAIPMTIIVCRKINNKEPIGLGLKICSLLFVSTIAGILLLCIDDEEEE